MYMLFIFTYIHLIFISYSILSYTLSKSKYIVQINHHNFNAFNNLRFYLNVLTELMFRIYI